jgi:hypothetical protein
MFINLLLQGDVMAHNRRCHFTKCDEVTGTIYTVDAAGPLRRVTNALKN